MSTTGWNSTAPPSHGWKSLNGISNRRLQEWEERMSFAIDRRSLLKTGSALLAATALPRTAIAEIAIINYWHHFTSQTEFAGLDAVLKAFAAAHPEITVTQENIPNPEFMAKVTAA